MVIITVKYYFYLHLIKTNKNGYIKQLDHVCPSLTLQILCHLQLKPLTSHKLLVLKILIPIKVPIYKVEVAFTLDTLKSFMGSLCIQVGGVMGQ